MAALIASLRTTLSGYVRYRGREGHYAFLLHRFTGLGTLLFLAIHIVDTSFVYFYPHLYEEALNIYRWTPFMIGEILLVFAVIYHGINGFRVIYVDMVKPAAWTIKAQRKAATWTLAVSIVLWLPAAGIMGYNLLHHNFGMFGG
jgi:succinate dehydrogenase / fumarate reductase cytochrome b subunit